MRENMESVARFEIGYTRLLDREGKPVADFPQFAKDIDLLKQLYRHMVRVRTWDSKAVSLQRTGRLGTIASSLGQEAMSVGVAAAMRVDDVFLPSFREQGGMFVRGVTPTELFLFWGGDERGRKRENRGADEGTARRAGTSGLIETNRSQHQTSYHIEMSGISVNNGRLERDRSVGIYPLARKLGVELTLVSPTGPKDTITRADVERAAQALADAGPLEKLRGVRRAMMRNMTLSGAEVVPATVTEEADVESWPEGTDITVRLVRAIVAGCVAEPALNAWYDGDQRGRRLHTAINLGIAVDTEDGLFVPVLRDTANRTVENLRAGLDRMMADVRARTVPAEELRGQTITLSNFGMIGGLHANLVVVPPQVAIVGAGRITSRVVLNDEGPAAHRFLPLSLTFDHRVVTGAEAARFVTALKAHLEQPS